jgi:hypothetical protein
MSKVIAIAYSAALTTRHMSSEIMTHPPDLGLNPETNLFLDGDTFG